MSNNPRKLARWDRADEEHYLTLLSPSQLAWYKEHKDRHNMPRPTKEEHDAMMKEFHEKVDKQRKALEDEYGLPYEEALVEQERQKKEAAALKQAKYEKERADLLDEANKVASTITLESLIEKGCHAHSRSFAEVRGYTSYQASSFATQVHSQYWSFKYKEVPMDECVARLQTSINVMFKKK